jgi:uncharacterized phage infection (PIP) family protein YhgE
MDIQTIDQQYQQMQTQAQQVAQQLQGLAAKLQTAAQAGNTDAREWLLDLREAAMTIQTEQLQMGQLLQAIHAMWQGQAQTYASAPAPIYAPQQPAPSGLMPQQGGLLGTLNGFLGSGFGRAMEMGAGVGLGEDLINKIF